MPETATTTGQDLRKCPHWGPKIGGVITSHDPYGVRKTLGLRAYPWRSICWACWNEWGQAEEKQVDAETRAAIVRAGWCGFVEAYIGPCRTIGPCTKHDHQRCWKCGAKATRNCADASFLVCGIPECDEHRHEHRSG